MVSTIDFVPTYDITTRSTQQRGIFTWYTVIIKNTGTKPRYGELVTREYVKERIHGQPHCLLPMPRT